MFIYLCGHCWNTFPQIDLLVYQLTLQWYHATSVLLETTMKHVDRCIVPVATEHGKCSSNIMGRLLGLWLCHAHIVVEYKEADLVARLYANLQLGRFNCGSQVDLAGGQSPKHYAGYAEVDGASDVRLAVLVRAATVEYDQLLGVVAAPQLRLEPLFGATLVLRFGHFESFATDALTHTLPVKAFEVLVSFGFFVCFCLFCFFSFSVACNFLHTNFTTKCLHHLLLLLLLLPGAHFLYFCCFYFPFVLCFSLTRTQNTYIGTHAQGKQAVKHNFLQ